MSSLPLDPVLGCAEALVFEKSFFDRVDEAEWNTTTEWTAMNEAGQAIANTLWVDHLEGSRIGENARILVLVGKGHNGGDALVATNHLLENFSSMGAVLWPLAPWDECRPNLIRALEELVEKGGERVMELPPAFESEGPEDLERILDEWTRWGGFSATLDGLLGMQAKLPLHSPLKGWVSLLNRREDLGVRFAVDLPTGLAEDEPIEDEDQILRADFTYCTGIVKSPVLRPEVAERVGRLRYLDLGFFETPSSDFEESTDLVLRNSALDAVRTLRPAISDKRSFGHLFLLAGSRNYAGAAMMAAEAALKAGVGLLTVGIPESLHAAFAAHRPEAMWIPLPETPDGGLALEGLGKVRQFLPKATALATGPGLGTEAETHSLVRETLSFFDGPAVLDADALHPEILNKVPSPERLVLTPHAGEFKRLSEGRSPSEYARGSGSVLVLKGPHTQVYAQNNRIHCLGGSSALARGGSGDLLTGIIGGILAKGQFDPLDSALLGTRWHARAAELMTSVQGQEAIFATELLDYLYCSFENDF